MLTGLVSLGNLQEAKKEEAKAVSMENYAGPKPQSHEQVEFLASTLSRRGFPGGASGKQLACQCRRCKKRRFEPWVGKIPWRKK